MEKLQSLVDMIPLTLSPGVKATVVVAGSVAAAAVSMHIIYQKMFSTKKQLDYPRDTVILHQVIRGHFAPSLSPFPIKLETYLRLAKIPYTNDHSGQFSSKGKTPWITYNGKDVADSQLSINFLNNQLKVDLNRNLSKEQRAIARTIQVMVDEHLYWTLVYVRWVYDPKKRLIKETFPSIFFWLFVRTASGQLHAQGIGRHDAKEVKGFMESDLTALSNILGKQKFMMGDHLTEADCSVFGILCQLIYHQEDDLTQGLVEAKYPSLYEYCLRVKETVWPDWDQCITHNGTRKATA